MNSGAIDFVDTQRHLAIVQQKNVVDLHIFVQIFIGDADALDVTIELTNGGIEIKRIPPMQGHPVFPEAPDTYLGSLQVADGANEASAFSGCLAQEQQPPLLLLVIAMGKIKTCHIETGNDHIVQRFQVIRRGPERCDYLCSA